MNPSAIPTSGGVLLVIVGIVVLIWVSTILGVVLLVIGLGAAGFGRTRTTPTGRS